jgi:hypothetical protein
MIIFINEVKCNKNLLPRVNLELLTFFIAADFQVFGVFRNPQAGRQGFLLGGVHGLNKQHYHYCSITAIPK